MKSIGAYLGLLFLFVDFVGAAGAELLIPGAQTINHKKPSVLESELRVPLDWYVPSDPRRLAVRFRLYSPEKPQLPLLIFIGGGPGMPSMEYYFTPDSSLPEELSKNFRVLVFDQRGSGKSTPLDPEFGGFSPFSVAQYFSSRQIIFDIGHFAETFNASRVFYLFGHSFGGLLISRYLLESASGPRPGGVVFLSSGVFADPLEGIKARYLAQIKMNHEMPQHIRDRVRAVRELINQKAGGNSALFHDLLDARFIHLSNWDEFERDISALLQVAKSAERSGSQELPEGFENILRNNFVGQSYFSALPIILSNADLVSDEEVLSKMIAELPIEEWMILEAKIERRGALKAASQQHFGPWFSGELGQLGMFSQGIIPRLKSQNWSIPAVSILGIEDMYTPSDHAADEFRRHFSGPYAQVNLIPGGGHYDSLSEENLNLAARSILGLSEAYMHDVRKGQTVQYRAEADRYFSCAENFSR